MRTKIITLLTLCITLTYTYAQNDAYHDTLLTHLQNDYGLSGSEWVLSPNEAANATNAKQRFQ